MARMINIRPPSWFNRERHGTEYVDGLGTVLPHYDTLRCRPLRVEKEKEKVSCVRKPRTHPRTVGGLAAERRHALFRKGGCRVRL